jgi:hypothetical protein
MQLMDLVWSEDPAGRVGPRRGVRVGRVRESVVPSTAPVRFSAFSVMKLARDAEVTFSLRPPAMT